MCQGRIFSELVYTVTSASGVMPVLSVFSEDTTRIAADIFFSGMVSVLRGTLLADSSIGGFQLEEEFVFDPLLVFEFLFDTNLDGSWSMLLAGNGVPVLADSDAGNNGGFVAAGGVAKSGPKDIPELGMLGLFSIGFLGVMVARSRDLLT